MTTPLFPSALKIEKGIAPLARNDPRRVIYPHDEVLWGTPNLSERDQFLQAALMAGRTPSYRFPLFKGLSWVKRLREAAARCMVTVLRFSKTAS